MGGFCINHDVTVEASPTGDAMCRTNKDCGKDGKCMSGLCLASSKLRFARRSPQVQCHKDKDCASPEGPGKCIAGGVCIAPDRKLKERTPQVQCHNDKDCASPDGPGKCIAGGICIAPDRKLKERSVDSESTHDELGTRSPQVQCRKDKDCASPEGPGKCIAGGICIAPDRKLKTREPVDSAHDELVTRSPQLMCKHDKDCASPEGPGKCIAGGICIAPNRK
ncbi:hypothetical protein BDW74DRAFT_127354 [Aspergillus multicolor]|uniref:uncharacterized protein n=1 Tax=Aspergillus multicolor TaxID=41759 RepID=UPI003CCCD5B0